MKIGVDFGTSYTTAAVRTSDSVRLFDFGGASQFRTAVYFPERLPDLSTFSFDPELLDRKESMQGQLRRELKVRNDGIFAKRKLVESLAIPQEEKDQQLKQLQIIKRSEAQLSEDAAKIVRREWLDAESRRLASAPPSLEHAAFGDDAIHQFIESPKGKLFESPKSLLAYDFDSRTRTLVRNVIATILERVRAEATSQLKVAVHEAILGRPVIFKAADSSGGEARALTLLREAADMAGYTRVDFLEEPVAAAMEIHQHSARRMRFVLLDVGGGTTDAAVGELGGRENPKVFGSFGLPKGGTDADRELSLARVMPHYGRGTGIPNHYFFQAASVHNFPAQREFRNRSYLQWPSPFDERLEKLSRGANTTVLNEQVERAKIRLSSQLSYKFKVDLGNERGNIEVTRDQLRLTMQAFLSDLQGLMHRARSTLEKDPEIVILTGGMSQSPLVQSAAQGIFPEARVVVSDPSYAVVKGLALEAAKRRRV